MLFSAPELTAADLAVIDGIGELRRALRHHVAEPKRWPGLLRRTLQARAIRGSNSIEGYLVTLDDAVAAVDEEQPLSADERTWAEIVGYRDAMTYVQQLGDDPHFGYDESLVRSLHFMMLRHDLVVKSAGRYRTGPIYVRNDATGEVVYEGPDAALVPGLVSELTAWLQDDAAAGPVYVRAALAHLNLVMIHPFRDGNGRMARALQTLVLARDGILAPEFSSIEEYLGRNTDAYYDVLARTGEGAWHPENDTSEWIRFTLRAHHIQAQTVRRRVETARDLYAMVAGVADRLGLPERTTVALFDAAQGLRVRRAAYERAAEVEPATAGRDLRQLTKAGLLVARGETRGRHYVAGPGLDGTREVVRATREPVVDPYADAS
ncbi:MAG TPA: Fic family protein [Frankiaceae bacterium]|nr:Fic family protein [Frankiaceae bacterium]